eukprot:TRINITY_DN7991_c0_g1_i3.p1 TRINITY_DN7991_c0_g1~~TRINITY_DN7991_c0_g1_i3.p1  ORF type:complete len:168 (+),score=13.35 TRINITY_DN7991_c0_g1_i3:81-584(+)
MCLQVLKAWLKAQRKRVQTETSRKNARAANDTIRSLNRDRKEGFIPLRKEEPGHMGSLSPWLASRLKVPAAEVAGYKLEGNNARETQTCLLPHCTLRWQSSPSVQNNFTLLSRRTTPTIAMLSATPLPGSTMRASAFPLTILIIAATRSFAFLPVSLIPWSVLDTHA